MKRNKIAVLLVCSALLVSAFAGFTACKPDEPDGPGGDRIDREDMTFTADGTVYNTVTAKTYTATRTDTRSDAYSAYSSTGTLLGNYKTIAAAINACVEEDADSNVFGSYVTRVGETAKIFKNRAGFATNNDEMFWYYEAGTMLDAMDCWDTSYMSLVQNTDYVVHRVQGYGTRSTQSYNGYGLLDANGAEIDPDNTQAQTWELSTAMEAAVLQMPSRLTGVTGLDYTIDLSQMKITPAYDGSDTTYAFMGFYSWQDYYVITMGIACDVNTGNWYPFEATSRDNSFSGADYTISDQCLLTSTWNEAGYFEPDAEELTMSIRTKQLEDDMGLYQVNDLEVTVKDGATYLRRMDDSLVNEKFPGASIGYENAYVFVAGLDVKADVETGVLQKNVDFFNGAKWENLIVKSATAHVPSTEEMSDTTYGFAIDPDWRGKDHSLVMASTEEKTEGILDYTILNGYAFTSWKAQDGCDVYTFDLNKNPVGESAYGSNAGVYQSAIDALGDVTLENVAQYEEQINAVGLWYGDDENGTNSTLTQRYRTVLDFSAYLTAKELLAQSAQLTEEGQAVADAFGKLGNILSYPYLGWVAPDDATEIVGYLYTELEQFRKIKADYDALSSEDKIAIFYRINRTTFDTWTVLSDEIAALMENEAFQTGVFRTYDKLLGSNTLADYTSVDALSQLIEYANKISRAVSWTDSENDDGNNAGSKVMAFDTSTYPSLRIIACVEYFDSLGLELPTYVKELLTAIEYDSFYEGAYYPIAETVKLAQRIATENLTSTAELTDEEMAFLNVVWVNGYTISAHIAWNWNSGNKFEMFYSSRTGRIAYVAGGRLTNEDGSAYKTYQYFDVVAAFLTSNNYTVNTNGWGVTADVIERIAPEHTDDSRKVLADIQALSDLASYSYLGWTTTESAIAGYLYSEVVAFRGVQAAYDALPGTARMAVRQDLTAEQIANFEAWGVLSEELAALMESEAFRSGVFKAYETIMSSTAIKDFTSEEALSELIEYAYKISVGTQWGGTNGENDDTNASGVKVMNFDNNCYPSLRVVACVEYFESLGLELPTYVQNLLSAIEYDNFYQGAYYPIAGTVKLAQRIVSGSLTINDMTEEEMAFLNEIWNSEYEISAFLSWNWNSGSKFEKYMSSRTGRIVLMAGGTLTNPDSSAFKTYQYFDAVAEMLSEAGYTIKENGWGVTVANITKIVLSAAAQSVQDDFVQIGDPDDWTTYEGWQSTDGTNKGYLYNQIQLLLGLQTKFMALSADDQATLLAYNGLTMEAMQGWIANWSTVVMQVTALTETDAYKNATITTRNVQGNADLTLSGPEALTSLIRWSMRIKSSVGYYQTNEGDCADDRTNPKATVMTSDNDWMASFYVCFVAQKMQESKLELPAFLKTILTEIGYYDSAFRKDFDYLYNVLSLAQKIEAGTITSITQEVADVVNAYMVNFSGFSEGGLAWNFNATQGKEFLYRSKVYKTYFGFDVSTDLIVCIGKVTKLLTDAGYTLTSNGLGVTESVTVKA